VSEFLKLLIATSLYYREWRRRGSDYEAVKEEVDLEDIPEAEARTTKSWGAFCHDCLTEVSPDSKYGFMQLALFYVVINNTVLPLAVPSCLHAIRDADVAMSPQVFVLFKLADPGTIQLFKSAITIVTAIVMVAAFRTTIAKLQWIAIVLQVCVLFFSNTSWSNVPGIGLWSHRQPVQPQNWHGLPSHDIYTSHLPNHS
jgi:hypothetical protein